ncbi:hypothetical protein ACHAW6_012763 [Cyclotella cf. meneghiniana]
MDHQRVDSIANEYSEFVRLESHWVEHGSGPAAFHPHQHALEQLVESNMGEEITAYAQHIIDSPDESFENIVARDLSESSSFRLLQGAVQNFYEALVEEHTGSGDNNAPNKKPKIPETPHAAPTSFSLFDMLDQQKEAFVFPPRITATMVIDAHQGEAEETPNFRNDPRKTDEYKQRKSALELLEEADDIEDLSPDPQSWEQIRQILYGGLNSSIQDKNSVREQSRFLKVHESLLDVCRRGNGVASNRTYCWDLAQNLVGSILSFSSGFIEKLDQLEKDVSSLRQYMDFYWDTVKCLLASLSHLALDYITSCVGEEREIERMMLGICFMLTHDVAACTTASIDPLAEWFEVWARFAPPKRMLSIVQCSGLGGIVLQRCYQRGKCTSAKKLENALNKCNDNGEYTSLDDVERAIFLQSLSILRVVLHSCGSSPSVVTTISQQLAILGNSPNVNTTQYSISSFLTANGVGSLESVHELLNQTECDSKILSKNDFEELPTAIEVTFKAFHDTLAANELKLTPNVEWICKSSLEIYSELKNETQQHSE